MEHVQSLGRDVVLMALPMGTARPYTSSSGTAFPASLALGALLVATDKQSSTHPRQADLGLIRNPYCSIGGPQPFLHAPMLQREDPSFACNGGAGPVVIVPAHPRLYSI